MKFKTLKRKKNPKTVIIEDMAIENKIRVYQNYKNTK